MKSCLILFWIILIAPTAFSGQVEVTDVKVNSSGQNHYRFDVTLKHADTGWKHYANRWEILDMDGKILATRVLYHPHVNEQPFTRSLSTRLPKTVKKVIVRGHDMVHKYGKKVKIVNLPK
ncbi:MAG: hypothetical protein GY786_00170 [Proteobacteria bacterium]|nr:hypothetical protein [Pseudomonadota bacterium]